MWLLFPCTFSQHKMQHHPSATVSAAQHISGASLNFPSCIRTNPKLFTAMSVTRCSGPSCRSVASRSRRRSGSASAKAPRCTRFHGSVEERGHFFNYLWCRGIFLDPSPWWENEILGFELFWFHLSSCHRLYFIDAIFDACCKCCCLLQSTAFTFAALRHFWMQISGDKTIQFLTQQ